MTIVTVQGKTIQFPDTMSSDEIKAVLQKKFPSPKTNGKAANQDKSLLESTKENVEGLARGGLKGATFNFSDELVGALGAFGARIARPDLFEGESLKETTQRGVEIQRAKEQAAKEAAPKSFLTGEIGGAIGTSAAGLSTKAGGKLAGFVANAPTKAGAFARGGLAAAPAGALQSFGQAEGDVLERTPEAIGGGAFTALTAGSLTAGGKALAEKFAPKVKTALSDIPLTLGQSTQNAIQQSFEESALKGAKGETAQQALSGFRELQENAIKRKLSDIKVKDGNEFELISSVVDSIKDSRSAMNSKVSDAYRKAGKSGMAVLDTRLIRNSLGESIKDIEEKFVLADSPNARKLINQFRRFTKDDKTPSNIIRPIIFDGVGLTTLTDIVQLEKWRSRVTTAANNTNNRQEAAFLSAVRTQYDNFVDDVLDNALVQGDEQTLRLYKSARNLRKDFGKRFESDKIVSKILTEDTLTPENVTNMIIGAGSVRGKETTARVVDSLYKAAGKNKPEVQEQLKSALLDRVFTRSASKQLGSNEQELLSFAKLDKEINLLLNKNSSLANKVFEKGEVKALQDVREALKFINSKKPGVVNNSNTYEKLAQNIGVFKTIPLINIVSQSIKDASNAKEAARAIGQISPIVKQSANQTKFLLSGAAALPQSQLQENE